MSSMAVDDFIDFNFTEIKDELFVILDYKPSTKLMQIDHKTWFLILK